MSVANQALTTTPRGSDRLPVNTFKTSLRAWQARYKAERGTRQGTRAESKNNQAATLA